jgi:hypothetical protein
MGSLNVDLNTNGLIDEFIRVDDLFQYPNITNDNSQEQQQQTTTTTTKLSQNQTNNFINAYNESTVGSNNSNSVLGDDLIELYEFTNDITLDDTKRKSPVDQITNIKLDLTIEGHGIKPPKWWHNFDLLDSPSESGDNSFFSNTTTPLTINTVQEPVVTSTSGKNSVKTTPGGNKQTNNKDNSAFSDIKKNSPRNLQSKPISTSNNNHKQQVNGTNQKSKIKTTSSPIIF